MWDERYNTDEYVYGTDPNEFLVSVADRIPKGRVMSLAEGEGRNAVYLAGLGYAVTAVDASAVGLEKARRLADTRGVAVETIVADLAALAIEPDSWDGIVSIFCHVPAALRRVLHRKVREGLRPGGVFVLEAYTPAQLEYRTGGPPDVDRLMSLTDLEGELAGLKFILGRETEREVVEGRFHTGRGAVVQAVARKPLKE